MRAPSAPLNADAGHVMYARGRAAAAAPGRVMYTAVYPQQGVNGCQDGHHAQAKTAETEARKAGLIGRSSWRATADNL
eukprot:1294685-Alexandrium_andersonii.AAC.1